LEEVGADTGMRTGGEEGGWVDGVGEIGVW